MPKTKKSQAVQRRPNQPVLESVDTENIYSEMDEAKLKKLKEKLLKEQPELQHVFQLLEKTSKERVEQAQNSSVVFANKRGTVTEELLVQYPNSPTAKQTMVALNHYKYAFSVLWSYSKPRVLLQSDCDFIQPGLHHYIEGFMIAQYMSQQFPLPSAIETWVEDYMLLRPNDSLVEYFYVSIVLEMQARKKSDYESCKDIIRAREMLVQKLIPFKSVETEKRILIDSYYVLGAKYTTTDQDVRAVDAFENFYALDETNIAALYSLAFHYKDNDPEKSLKFCNRYLDTAPRCDEKYPNVYYVMGYIYAIHFKNIELAKKYYRQGEKAETYRLPFNPPTDFGPKTFLKSIVPLAGMKRKELKNALEHIDLD